MPINFWPAHPLPIGCSHPPVLAYFMRHPLTIQPSLKPRRMTNPAILLPTRSCQIHSTHNESRTSTLDVETNERVFFSKIFDRAAAFACTTRHSRAKPQPSFVQLPSGQHTENVYAYSEKSSICTVCSAHVENTRISLTPVVHQPALRPSLA